MELIDISNVNGAVDWPKVKRAGIGGVWLKATEGKTFDDPYFASNRRRANAAGLRVGAYHFARPENNTAQVEADHFCKVIGPVGRRDLKPVLDMEGKGDEAWAHAFSQRVKLNLGVTPIFYSYTAWIKEHSFKTPVGNGLWLADYGVNNGGMAKAVAPKPWTRFVAHQYTSVGSCAGVSGHVDRSWGRTIGILARPVAGLL